MKHLLLFCLMLVLPAQSRADDYARRAEVQAFIDEMATRHGFDRAGLSALFHATRPIAAVLQAIRPPENPTVRSWRNYRSRFVEPVRIAAGRYFMHLHAAELAAAETRFGVPAEIITAIIGIETMYGKQTGNYNTFAALTTLAFDYPPRAGLFRQELAELLLLARAEGRAATSYAGSYAGALGLPQFLPSSLRRYAIDFDNDGRIDLAASPADAIGSVARFLAAQKWQKDGPIAERVTVSGSIQALLDEGITPKRRPMEMAALGVQAEKAGAGLSEGGLKNPSLDKTALIDQPAALIDLVTPGAATEYRLGYHNFWAITRYNRSSFYAATVMDLAGILKD